MAAPTTPSNICPHSHCMMILPEIVITLHRFLGRVVVHFVIGVFVFIRHRLLSLLRLFVVVIVDVVVTDG